MKKIFLCMVCFLVLLFGFTVSYTSATLIISGDTNITDPLVGAQGSIIDPGNQQFFTNLLQGRNSVVVLEGGGSTVWQPYLNVDTFYNNLPGVTSTVISGTVTDAQIEGADLFVSPLPDDIFTVSEIAALKNFLIGGGTIFFLGEHAGGVLHNQIINDTLTALGSSMTIIPNSTFDTGVWNTATGPQIAVDPFTTSITTFTYNTPSQVDGGTYLFFGNLGQPFVSYEEYGAEPPIPTVPSILQFFDDSVANGTLVGSGRGNSAGRRLNALRNMIATAGEMIADGSIEDALGQLLDVMNRIDGEAPPPDFATGDSASVLLNLVEDLYDYIALCSWYLIITPDEFYEEVLPLAASKQEVGLFSKVVRLSDIGSSPSADQIADFIRDEYEGSDGALKYLLLVGDVAYVPTHYRPDYGSTTDLHATDLYYATMDSVDYLPDICVGRLPANSSSDVKLMVDKIIGYVPSTNKVLLFGNSPEVSYADGDEPALTAAGFVVDKAYDSQRTWRREAGSTRDGFWPRITAMALCRAPAAP